MVNTSIILGESASQALSNGSQKLADAVGVTFGPYGKNVIIGMEFNEPHVTKDGVTVARAVKLENKSENLAASIIKQAAQKTAEVAGDGTTSTTILTNALIQNSFKTIKDGAYPIDVARYLKEAEVVLLDKLKELSTDISEDNIVDIALVASNGDKSMSELVAEAFKIVGKDGLVSVSDSRNYKTTLEATEGIKLDRSHIIPSLSLGKTHIKHLECKILVTNADIKSTEDAFKLVKLQAEINKPLLIICNDLTDEAAKVISYNKNTNNLPLEVIRAPFVSEARQEALLDLSIVTGGFFVDKNKGWNITDVLPAHLGDSDYVEMTLKETNIIGRKGDSKAIESRIEYYNTKISQDKEGLTENYKKRLAIFTSGAAIIYVGGANESEIKETKDRLDDTIRAVKSALEEGYVPGGATTYWELKYALEDHEYLDIMNNSLESLLLKILANSDNKVSINTHKKSVEFNNIIDPTLVVKATIQNSIAAAIMVFNTGGLIIKNQE
jgi:chaperonin GroEL